MNIYIDHANPTKEQDLAFQLTRHGIPQVIARQLATEIIQHRYTTYANLTFTHLGR